MGFRRRWRKTRRCGERHDQRDGSPAERGRPEQRGMRGAATRTPTAVAAGGDASGVGGNAGNANVNAGGNAQRRQRRYLPAALDATHPAARAGLSAPRPRRCHGDNTAVSGDTGGNSAGDAFNVGVGGEAGRPGTTPPATRRSVGIGGGAASGGNTGGDAASVGGVTGNAGSAGGDAASSGGHGGNARAGAAAGSSSGDAAGGNGSSGDATGGDAINGDNTSPGDEPAVRGGRRR